MKNLEKSYLEIPLLLSKVNRLVKDVGEKVKESQVKDDIVFAFNTEFNQLVDNPLQPIFKGDSPTYRDYFTIEFWNDTLKAIYKDLETIMSEFETLEDYNVEKFNDLLVRLYGLITYSKKLYGRLTHLKDYFYDVKSRYYWVEETFSDNSRFDLGSSSLKAPQCDIDMTEGVATCPRVPNKKGANIVIEEVKINAPSNGQPGNSILALTENREDPFGMVDGNPSTWFEYELMRPSGERDKVLYLDMTFKLAEEAIVNNLVMEFINDSTQDFVSIEEIRTSFDGQIWDSVTLNDQSLSVGEEAATLGVTSFTTHPRNTRFINIKLSQGIPKSVKTQYGSRERYFIAIKTLSVNAVKYKSIGELVTERLDFPLGYNYVSLITSEYPMLNNPAYEFQYFVSPDEPNNWMQILPSNYTTPSDIPKVLEYNTDGKDATILPDVPKSLYFKVKLVRHDADFADYFVSDYEDTEIITESATASELRENKLLGERALIDTVAVERTDLGSVGQKHKCFVANSNVAPNQEHPIPIDISKTDFIPYVANDAWKVVRSFANSGEKDKHCTINIRNNTIKFGDGTNGLTPTGPISIGVKQDLINFSPSNPHIGTLKYNCDGIKDNTKLYAISPYKFVKNQLVGRGVNEIDLKSTNIYSYETVYEELPRNSSDIVLGRPVFVTPDFVFDDKIVFANEVDSAEDVSKGGDYYIEINEISKLCTIRTYTSTNSNYSGFVQYNCIGKLVPEKIGKTKPRDKANYYTAGMTDSLGLNEIGIKSADILNNITIKVGDVLRLIAKSGNATYVRVTSVRTSGNWKIVAFSTTLSDTYRGGTNTRYFVQLVNVKSMAPVFSNKGVFKKEVPYKDGKSELEDDGSYSINYEQGKVYTFTPTSRTSLDSIDYYYEGKVEVDQANWDFVYEGASPSVSRIAINDSAYMERPRNVNYAVDSEGHAYIKPGKGCNTNKYTRIRYDDEFLQDPTTPRSIICGSSAQSKSLGEFGFEDNDGHSPSDVPWGSTTVQPNDPDVTVEINTDKSKYTFGDNQIIIISLTNNTSTYTRGDVYIDLEVPNGKVYHMMAQGGMYIPPDFYIDDLRIIDNTIEEYLANGQYTLWFGIFEPGTFTPISNVNNAVYTFASNSPQGGHAGFSIQSGNLKSTFVPYHDLERGKFLPEGTQVVDLGHKHIVKGSVKFVCTSTTNVCVNSYDNETEDTSIHLCRKGFGSKTGDSSSASGKYYNAFCRNASCPLYLNVRDYTSGLFGAERTFINGASEFQNLTGNYWSLNYEDGILYTTFNTPADTIMVFSTSSHKIEYNITLPLTKKQFEFKDNGVKIIDQGIVNTPTAQIAIKYRKRKGGTELVSKLREYFTPILKGYKVRIGRRFIND